MAFLFLVYLSVYFLNTFQFYGGHPRTPAGGCDGELGWADAVCGFNQNSNASARDGGRRGAPPKLSPHIWSYFCGPYRGSPPKSSLGENPSGDRVALGCALGGLVEGADAVGGTVHPFPPELYTKHPT